MFGIEYKIYTGSLHNTNKKGENGMKDKKERIILNIETGEIMGEIRDGDRIVRSKSIKMLSGTQIWRIEKFTKGSLGEIRALIPELTSSEKSFLFCMSAYVGYEDCCLEHDNGTPLSRDCMMDITGLSRATIFNVLNSLRKKDIIFKGKNSQGDLYFINPWIYCRGNRINNVLKTMFKNYKVRVINKRWGDL